MLQGRRPWLLLLIGVILAANPSAVVSHEHRHAAQSDKPKTSAARGLVYEDENENRQYDKGEPLLVGVRVSNGETIVTTSEQGAYELPVGDDTALFVIKPRGYRTPLDENQLPQFYYLHKPAGSPKSRFPGVAPTGPLPESVDFALYKQDEPEQFHAILFGDPQPRDQKEIDYIAHDVVEDLVGSDASFGVTLGDIMFDNLSLFGSLNRTIAMIGIPWYNVIGNHDINRDADLDIHSDETFENAYGPSYYSYDYGTVHFLVLDDVDWYVQEDGRKTYRGGLSATQLNFVKEDLALVPENQLVVLMMHIPVVDMHNRKELYRLIEKRPFCMSISAHTHYMEHRLVKKEDGWLGAQPHHHVINVTVSGSWWSGKKDERGIPHTTMRDGAPNGYSIISFDGHEYSLEYRAAHRPRDYQLRIHAPEVVAASQTGATEVFVNVFAGSERSTTSLRVRGRSEWTPLERTVQSDPYYVELLKQEASASGRDFRELPGAVDSTHLWRGNLPDNLKAGTYLIEVKSTDMHGQTHIGRRFVRVSAEAAAVAD